MDGLARSASPAPRGAEYLRSSGGARSAIGSAFIIYFVLRCLGGCSSAPPSAESEAVSRVSSVVPALADAFSACDLHKLASLYSASAEFIAPDTRTPIIGREAVIKHLAGACTSTYKPVMKVLAQRVYRLGSDGAVISGTYTFGRSDRANEVPWAGSFIITLVKSGDSWLVQSQATFAPPT